MKSPEVLPSLPGLPGLPKYLMLLIILAVLAPMRVWAQAAPMTVYWPNGDGRSWTYEQTYEEFYFGNVHAQNTLRLFFDGVTVAPVGIPAQVLDAEVVLGATGWSATAASDLPDYSRDGMGGSRAPAFFDRAFDRALWTARPDLRAVLSKRRSATGLGRCPEDAVAGAYLNVLDAPFAFVKDEFEVGAWRCNADNTQAWLWMTNELSLGGSFTIALIPDIASDVFLHGSVGAFEDVTVPLGTFSDCLRMDYRIDYGSASCVDDGGAPTGTSRLETHGYVYYAPRVGPVQAFEELIIVEATGSCAPFDDLVGEVLARGSMDLVETSPVPAHHTTWGRVKAVFGPPQ